MQSPPVASARGTTCYRPVFPLSLLDPYLISSYDKVVERKGCSGIEGMTKVLAIATGLNLSRRGSHDSEGSKDIEQNLEPEECTVHRSLERCRSDQQEHAEGAGL